MESCIVKNIRGIKVMSKLVELQVVKRLFKEGIIITDSEMDDFVKYLGREGIAYRFEDDVLFVPDKNPLLVGEKTDGGFLIRMYYKHI